MRMKNILQYLERAAEKWPERVCFTDGWDGGEELTFAGLCEMSQRVGSALIREGAGYGNRVALLMTRHPAALTAMFGTVYAGASYLVLDPDAPLARWRQLLELSAADYLICDADHWEQAATLVASEDGAAGKSQRRVLLLDDLMLLPPEKESLLQVRKSQLDVDPIYTVFTSGSTGNPKGVVANHRSVIDYAEALGETIPFDENTVFGCQAPFFFDAPLKEILMTLRQGGKTCLVPGRLFSFPALLVSYLERNRVNTLCWVSSSLSALAVLGVPEQMPPTTVHTVVFGSERFPTPHYLRWRSALPQADFWQLYGPTEATGMSCAWHADREVSPEEPLPIGFALDNTEVLLLDDGNRRLNAWTDTGRIGEIYLRGTCVTMGYAYDSERTRTCFVQNPLQKEYPETVYRTGDLAYYNERTELVYVGRRDAQVKRMGHRMELGEIERCAQELPEIGLVACVAETGGGRIGLFYTGAPEEECVERWLRDRLPLYMLPDLIRKLPHMPQMPNGKLDRRGLAEKIKTGQSEKG